MFKTIVNKLLTANLWYLLITVVIFSEILTSLMSLILRGSITHDYLITGGVVSFIAAFILLYFIKNISELSKINENLQQEINQRKKVEEDLQRAHDELEMRVKERTSELFLANEQLRKEISQRSKAEEQLKVRAFYDPLTNLPNRALFVEHLQRAIDRKKRQKDFMFAVFFMDADRFKVINDSLGHLVGDQLLMMIGQRLTKAFRAVDKVARFGGDEFALLLEDIKSVDDVHILAKRIFDTTQKPFNLYGHEAYVKFSIGITTSEMSTYHKTEDMLRDADIALYDAKARGRGCHSIFEPTMHTQAVTILHVESELRRAVENNEFRVYYQPIVAMDNREIAGFEALVRWQHPERGLLSPYDFILIAEETDLIIPIGQWVLREACRQMSTWQRQYPEYRELTVSVNLSSREFAQPHFVEVVEKAIHDSGINPSSLKLEISERMIIERPELAATILKRLNEIHVRFDIDDFGTGHSALNYLRYFPINALKIDRSFISALTDDVDSAAIVNTIIALAHQLKIEVIAEGIETQDQMDVFKRMNGNYAQGYLFYKPMGKEEAETLLRKK